MSEEAGISESQFYMWRTLFALAHADHVVTDEEVRFMAEALEDIPFSAEQHTQLMDDTKDAQDIEQMFENIKEVKDQAEFFKLAHVLVHIDGDYGSEEQAIMLRLKELHLQREDLDTLVGSVGLELECDDQMEARLSGEPPFKKAVWSFRQKFLQERFGK